MTFETNTLSDNSQSEEVISPHPHDIICGRGGYANIHIGNLNYRELVEHNKLLYVANAKSRKVIVSKSIVKAIYSQNPPGRFLEKDKHRNQWIVLDEKRAIAKTSQALREKPIIQTLKHNIFTSSADKETKEEVTSVLACKDQADEFDTINIEPLPTNIPEIPEIELENLLTDDIRVHLLDDVFMSSQENTLCKEEHPQTSEALRTTSSSSLDNFLNKTIVSDDEESLDASTRKRSSSEVYQPNETQSKPFDCVSMLPSNKRRRVISGVDSQILSSLYGTNDYEPVKISYHCRPEEDLIQDGLKVLFPECFMTQHRTISSRPFLL